MTINKISLENFTNLSKHNKLMVLDWRNNKSVRKWMYSSNIISKDEHLAFIDMLEANKKKKYYLVSFKGDYIGVMYFIDITHKRAEFGIYSNPNLKGGGKILMDSVCEYGCRVLKLHKIIAEVFEDNQRAINLYHGYNFIKVGKGFLFNKKVIYMELKNENR